MSGGSISDRRSGGRATVLLSGTIGGNAEPMKIAVRNLSTRGALVEGPRLSAKESSLIPDSNGVSASGSIVWARDGRSGLQFDREVNYRAAFRYVAMPDRRARPRPNRPGLKWKPLTQGEKLVMTRLGTAGLTLAED